MSYLLDSGILVALANPAHRNHELARQAVETVKSRKEILYYTPQSLREFWNVCTRPKEARQGLGLTIAQTSSRARLIEDTFTLLGGDTAAIHSIWRELVEVHKVNGVKVHDAHQVASMQASGILHILTFDTAGFARYPILRRITRRIPSRHNHESRECELERLKRG